MSEIYEISPADVAALLLLPTLASGQAEDLKLTVEDQRDRTTYRVWLPRMTDADRAEYTENVGYVIEPVEVERRDADVSRWSAGAQEDLDRALELARLQGLI